MIIHADGAHHRKEIFFQQVIQNLRLYMGHISHITDILPAGGFPAALQKTSVFSADADRLDTKSLHHADQLLVHLVQHHLRHFHGVFIRNTEPVHKMGFHAYLADPPRDFLSSSVYNNRLKADQLQKNHIGDDVFLEFLIYHGAPAVFDHHDFSVKALNIGQRLNQHCRFIQIFLFDHFRLSLLLPGRVRSDNPRLSSHSHRSGHSPRPSPPHLPS